MREMAQWEKLNVLFVFTASALFAFCCFAIPYAFHRNEQSIDTDASQANGAIHIFPSIDKSRGGQIAVRDKLLALFVPHDPSSIFTVLDAISGNSSLSQNCHEIAHDLGHRAYELYGFSGAMALSDQNRQSYVVIGEICAGGYMHGIMEELLLDQPTLKNKIADMCATVPPVNRASCFHGIGHGLMFLHARDVSASLADCKTMGRVDDQTHCYEGVWMEMFWGDTGHALNNALGWSPDQPLQPCIDAPNNAKPACFLYANLGYLRMHSKDFAGAINECMNLKLSQSDRDFCLKGTGMTMMQYFLNHHLDQPENYVLNFKPEEKYAYYQGLIAYARLSDISDADIGTFCRTLKNDQDICLSILKNTPR